MKYAGNGGREVQSPRQAGWTSFPLRGVVSVALPAIDQMYGRKKTAMLSGADTACLGSFEPPLSSSMPNRVVRVNPLDIYIFVCIIKFMNFTWHEAKRQANLKKHGLDFADAEKAFAGPMAVFEDARNAYGEQRMIGIGLLDCLIVLIVHVESDETIRIISMRKADGDEINLFYQTYGVL